MSAANPRGGRDEEWFDAFFHTHSPAVRAYARRRVGADDADDVVVDVFATAWACRDQVPDQARPWLYRCAWHRIAARYRADARRARLVARVAAQPPGPVGVGGVGGSYGPDLAWVYDVLGALTADEAEILRLAAWEGLAPREIATVLGCTPGAARVRLHRARRKAEALCPPGVRRTAARSDPQSPRPLGATTSATGTGPAITTAGDPAIDTDRSRS